MQVTLIGAFFVTDSQAGGRRGLGTAASSAGMKTRLATKVQPRLISSKSPMLAVPGCADNASEPNAVPVVNAENRIARAVADPNTEV